MKEEFDIAINKIKYKNKKREVSIITGELASDFIKTLAQKLEQKCSGLKINVYPVKNNFFGGGVNVSGLVVGRDIIEQLKGKELGDMAFIPSSMLRSGEDVFLDDMTLEEVASELGVKIGVQNADGFEFAESITGEEIEF